MTLKAKIVYTVIMLRWGKPETHHYLIGVFSTLDLALKHAKSEEEYRGGKYEAIIQEVTMDIDYGKPDAHGIKHFNTHKETWVS